MNGIARMSACEIYANPYDISIFIGEGRDMPGKYGFMISRGPGHNYKPILSAAPVFRGEEEAIVYIKAILESIVKSATELLEKPGDFMSQIWADMMKDAKPEELLNQEVIERIITQLKATKNVDTHEFKK
jgi:hypothetical protein